MPDVLCVGSYPTPGRGRASPPQLTLCQFFDFPFREDANSFFNLPHPVQAQRDLRDPGLLSRLQLRLLLNVNAQLVAVLLLDLLVAELFGLVQSAIELRNQTLSPTLRQLALYGPLVVDKSLGLVGCQLCGIRFPLCRFAL